MRAKLDASVVPTPLPPADSGEPDDDITGLRPTPSSQTRPLRPRGEGGAHRRAVTPLVPPSPRMWRYTFAGFHAGDDPGAWAGPSKHESLSIGLARRCSPP